jgi:hypothetical protein
MGPEGDAGDRASPPAIVRAAAWIGRTLGRWRRRRLESKHDAVIAAWKAVWAEGCAARWAGQPQSSVPHRRGRARDAWLAGWAWADTHPDRRRVNPDTKRAAFPRRRAHDLDST